MPHKLPATVEKLLDDASLSLQQVLDHDSWGAYSATRPGRALAVETLLGTIRELRDEAALDVRQTPRSVANSIWSLARRHAASLGDFHDSRPLVNDVRRTHA